MDNRASLLRFVAFALLLVAGAYLAVFFPYQTGGVPARTLGAYLAAEATIAGRLIALFDPTVSVQGTLIAGRFPLEIALDCAALDVEAFFAAAVLAFPARWPRKLAALVVGLAALDVANLARIVLLGLTGVRAPRLFDLLHEDVMQILLVLVAAGLFARFALTPTERDALA